MAPNRKSLSSLVQTFSSQDLEGLHQTVQAKYLPLTHSQGGAITSEESSVYGAFNDGSSTSYWEWSANVPETDICVLSTDNIVSNLIQASNGCTSSSKEESSRQTVAQHDAYWAEESSSSVAPVVDAVDYWTWETSMSEDIAWPLVSAAKQRREDEQIDSDTYWAW